MFRGNSFVLSATVGILLLTLCGTAQTDIPKVISYQGKVTDSGGTPVADGTYAMRFWIYDAATGGTGLWDSGARSVDVSGGVFSVLLGESPQPILDLDFDQDYWLLVRFDGIDQTPRQRLASVGYSYTASGLIPGTEVIGEVTTGNRSAIKGTNTAASGYTYGIYGRAYSTQGYGVVGLASASSGTTYGVYGNSSSTTAARGVYGWASANSGFNVGVYGLSSSVNGRGVQGFAERTTGTTYGVYGENVSTDGCGVYGKGPGIGVYGQTYSSTGRGVLGRAPEYGVYGEATATSGTSYAGRFVSIAPFGTGVEGQATAAGHANYGVAGLCWSASGFGVYGWNDGGGPAVYAAGNFGASGTKSCVVRSSQGPTMLYCQESPECWFEDFGEGQLVDGRVNIGLDPLFLETVTIDGANPMKVFVELGDECNGVFVRRGVTGFDVIELHGGSSSVPFCYRVVAKRKGFEEKRLDYCKAAETDPNLYTEVREKLLREHEEERVQMEGEQARMKLERARMMGGDE